MNDAIHPRGLRTTAGHVGWALAFLPMLLWGAVHHTANLLRILLVVLFGLVLSAARPPGHLRFPNRSTRRGSTSPHRPSTLRVASASARVRPRLSSASGTPRSAAARAKR